MSADHTTRAHLLSVAPDGRRLICSIREGGQDGVEVRVRDMESGEDLPDHLEKGLYSSEARLRNRLVPS